jgi:hypothetical protein
MALRWDGSLGGSERKDPRHTPKTAELDVPFIIACVAMFDAGLDTCEIAGRLFEREAAVLTAIRLGREARRHA